MDPHPSVFGSPDWMQAGVNRHMSVYKRPPTKNNEWSDWVRLKNGQEVHWCERGLTSQDDSTRIHTNRKPTLRWRLANIISHDANTSKTCAKHIRGAS